MEQNHLTLAKQAIAAKDIITASVEATKAIAENPDAFEAYIIRSQISMAFGDKTGAAEDMRKAVELNPELLNMVNGEFKNTEGSSCH